MFQLYNGEPEATTILEDLNLCYDKFIQHKEGADGASEVLIEVLLSFISRPSVLLRKTAEQIFGTFASEISSGGLQSMIAVSVISWL